MRKLILFTLIGLVLFVPNSEARRKFHTDTRTDEQRKADLDRFCAEYPGTCSEGKVPFEFFKPIPSDCCCSKGE